jgi:hypothetical protein
MDALLVGPQQQLTGFPTIYGHCVAVHFNGTLEMFEQKGRYLLVITKI